MTRKTLLLTAATLGLAASFGSASASAQSVDTIYVSAPSEISAGSRALRRNRPTEAIRYLEKGLKKNISQESRVSGLNGLCIAYRMDGALEKAKENCSKAIALRPGYWRAYNNRANVYYDQENYLAALSDYEAALEIKPKSKLVRQNLRAVKTSVSMAD